MAWMAWVLIFHDPTAFFWSRLRKSSRLYTRSIPSMGMLGAGKWSADAAARRRGRGRVMQMTQDPPIRVSYIGRLTDTGQM